MNLNQVGVYVPVSEVFPDIQSNLETFKDILQQLSRTDTLFWCARINLIITNPIENGHISRQQVAIDKFLTKSEIEAVNQFAMAHGGANRVTVFFRGQLLELMRWALLYCHNHPNDGKTFEDPNTRRMFVQAALIASDLWSKWVYGNRFSLEGGIKIARERSLGAIRKAIEGTSLCAELTRSFGRGWTIFMDYFRKQYGLLASEFQSKAGLSIEDYFKCLLIITVHFANPRSNNTGIFNATTFADSTPLKDVFQKYITFESQSIDEFKNALWGSGINKLEMQYEMEYDYLSMREKPILRAEDNRAIILDPIFYSEKASIGPLFVLTKNKARGKANEVFSAFGKAFENYSCDILNKMFPDINAIKQLFCNLKKKDLNERESEIDACINKGSESAIFEIKAVWIREDKILNENYETYLQHLREKYGVVGQQDNPKAQTIKGVGQLARILNNIFREEFQANNREFSEIVTIYPILLVYDSFLTAPVYGNFLASEFEKLLKPDHKRGSGELIKGRFTVHPLIILTIEDLENLELSVEHFSFFELLSDYSTSCPDRLISLKNYIADSKYNKQIYRNKNLANKCLELFKEAKLAIATKEQ
ncbi:MAG: hypothetical protein Q7K98_07665 [Candidatus Omnitrophota bacterium]|nr:hypothetical protein [Candidatus Omnitrophota bacterium]